MTVLSQVNQLDDTVFNTLPAQPPKKKTGSPSKQKGNGSGQSSSKQPPDPQVLQKSDKAQFIERHSDHTPEEPGVWTDMMKLPGTKRSNQISEGFVQWLTKNYDCVIHEVNTYLFFYSLNNNIFCINAFYDYFKKYT